MMTIANPLFFLPDRHDIKACLATHNPLGWHFSSHKNNPPSNVLTRSEYGYDTMDKSTNSLVLYMWNHCPFLY